MNDGSLGGLQVAIGDLLCNEGQLLYEKVDSLWKCLGLKCWNQGIGGSYLMAVATRFGAF